jgi:hypothetical protein
MTKQEQLRMEAGVQRMAREVRDMRDKLEQHRIDFLMSLVGFCVAFFLLFLYVTNTMHVRDEYVLSVIECMTEYRELNPESWLTDHETYETCRLRETRDIR